MLHVFYFSFRWGPFVHFLGIVQWNSTRRDHPGNPGGVFGSGPVRNTVLIVSRVPIAFWKLFQKCAVNLGSLSDTMDTGTPCSRTICRMYNRQNLSKAKVIRTGRKFANFVSRSTITHTASCFCCVRGKWVTKSIVTCSHFHSATSNG